VAASDSGDRPKRIHRSRADRSGRPHDEERAIAARPVFDDRGLERRRVHPEPAVDGDPAQSVRSQTEKVGRLLDPRVRLGRGIDAQPGARGVDSPNPHLLVLRAARGEEADEVRHVSPRDEDSAVARITDEIGNPAHRLRLDLPSRRARA
jgi:hypothetical protein